MRPEGVDGWIGAVALYTATLIAIAALSALPFLLPNC